MSETAKLKVAEDAQPQEPIAYVQPTGLAPTTTLNFPFCKDLVRPGPTTLQVVQKTMKVFKKSGRGFAITENASDGLPLFVVETGTQGKKRNFQDRNGNPLFDLKRNWMSQKKAWEVQDPDGKTVMTVKYEWMHLHMTFEAVLPADPADPTGGEKVVRIRANDVWQRVQEARVVDKSGKDAAGEPFLRAEVMNMPANSGFLSSYQTEPPIWAVGVAEGVNLGLAAMLAVCISDGYSEARIYMS